MGSNRIKGTKLKLELGTPGEDYWADLTAYALDNDEADADVTTFEDAANGGSFQHTLAGTAIQSTDSASFWTYVWDNTGEEVAFTLAPHGNAVPTVAQPHFLGTVKIGKKPTLGGEAGEGAFTFEFEWNLVGEPTKDTGA
jgi:hypothetical protein